jgi:hypothetical protein
MHGHRLVDVVHLYLVLFHVQFLVDVDRDVIEQSINTYRVSLKLTDLSVIIKSLSMM